MAYDNTNTIAIFPNRAKDGGELSPSAPILTGKCNVEGRDYKISLWARTSSKDNSNFWSGQIQPFGQSNSGGLPPSSASAMPAQEKQAAVNVGDDIPF